MGIERLNVDHVVEDHDGLDQIVAGIVGDEGEEILHKAWDIAIRRPIIVTVDGRNAIDVARIAISIEGDKLLLSQDFGINLREQVLSDRREVSILELLEGIAIAEKRLMEEVALTVGAVKHRLDGEVPCLSLLDRVDGA